MRETLSLLWAYLQTLWRNRKAGMSVKGIIMMAVALLLIGVLAPIGLGLIANANTANWDASVVTVFQVLLPILAVVGVALGFMKTRLLRLSKKIYTGFKTVRL